jgi:hypothetical protein
MTDDDKSVGRRGRRSVLDRIFPLEHDFLQMLADQASQTLAGVEAFVAWLELAAQGNRRGPRIERELTTCA